MSDIIGVGATRIELRALSALGLTKPAVHFESCESVEYGGVLFLLPFLLENGLLSYKKHYTERQSGYYDFDNVILLLAFMFLCRITNVEKLKHNSPGEMGKLLGLDRIPEARCLRGMIKELTSQKKAATWNSSLAQDWIEEEEVNIYYIDGHVQVYHGYLANLGKKHVSRQRLCLPGMTEFWVNNAEGLPFFYVTGEVNEKLQEMIENKILDELITLTKNKINKKDLDADPLLPCFTIAFDREAYSPDFFKKLWDKKVAVLTYKKNVKDLWDKNEFKIYQIKKEAMLLCEKEIEINGLKMREVRKLSDDGHQTSIVTTNFKLSIEEVALFMFARWTQENFFHYMRQEYDMDKIFQYGVNELDKKIKVVNREYSNLTHQLKKTREKISRRIATLYNLENENIKDELEKSGHHFNKQYAVKKEIEQLKIEEQEIIDKRKPQPYKISIEEMPTEVRYNKLVTESKHLQNIIKIICYRAETSLANLLAIEYKKSVNEIRSLLKSIIFNKVDLYPDYKNNILTVCLYSMATPRDNIAIEKICKLLNDYEAVFPNSNLKIIYKVRTMQAATDQEF